MRSSISASITSPSLLAQCSTRRQSRRLFLWGLVVLLPIPLVTGCGSGGAASSGVIPNEPASIMLAETLSAFDSTTGRWRANNGRWYTYRQSREPCETEFGGFPNNPVSPPSCFAWLSGEGGPGTGWVTAQGPWWVDPNHRQLPGGDGYGFVHVVAFTQIPAAALGPLDLTGTSVSFTIRRSATFSTVMAASRDGLRKGHVYLWFETRARPITGCRPDPTIGENCTRQSNYILTGRYDPKYELDSIADTEAKDLSFMLSADDPSLWTCLGRGENVKYDCLPIDEALRSVATIGLLLAPVAPCPALTAANGVKSCDLPRIDADPRRYFATGNIEIKDLKIRYPGRRDTEARLLQFPLVTPTDGWTSPLPSASHVFGPGSGLYLPIPIASGTMGAMRIGLSTEASPATLESAGLQLFLITAGTEPGMTEDQIRIVRRSDDGRYNTVLGIAPFGPQDSFSLHLHRDRLVFLRNDAALHSEPSPCPAIGDCVLTPFISLIGQTAPVPVYRYGGN